ncbi:hypothetical protein [Micromonospora sp. ATA51]|uniref:hypothetical protein n=1 Tax=Micromonospora sp. ATA51 TaxID=2806098 RepID=UPI001A4D7216|nr:hypothetical protein [Micromonospora sp. ATA51]MBM0227926.1 hypothetical protein [Micromonospora sp. ATA51]
MDGRIPSHRRRLTRLVAAAAVVAATLGLVAPPAHAEAGPKVDVLTRNLYLGGDLTPSIGAPTLPAFLAANSALLRHVDLVDFPARAALFAEEIRERKPTWSACRRWRSGAPDGWATRPRPPRSGTTTWRC